MSMFVAHEQVNAYMYRLFNIVSDALFWLNFNLRSQLTENSAYRGIHDGERCFIVATGPSLNGLNAEQVERIGNEYVFGVNSAYKAPIVSGINPDYYVLMDNNYWDISSDAFAEIHARYRDRPPVFITDVRAKKFLPPSARSILLYAKNYPINEMRSELHGNISIAMNVVGFSIISAIYMGFKEIYLLGCDYNMFCSPIGNHCYDDTSEFEKLRTYNLAFYLKYYHLTTEFHYLIAKLGREKNVKIVNLTEGSLLDAYPGMHISDVFGIN